MARMRSLKPEFWTDEELACQLTRDERLLYLGMWNLADEHARLRGDPRYIKGQLFAYDDDLTAADIERMLDKLASLGKVRRYSAGPGRYLFLPNLARHQRLEADKVPSRLPDPDESPPETDPSESRADLSARDSDEPASGANGLSLKHVAGGMEHVVPPTAGAAAPTPAAAPATPRRQAKTEDPERAKHAGDIVAAFVEGAASTGQPPPAASIKARVGKQARQLLAENYDAETLITSAYRMGAGEWNDLAVQVRKDAAGGRASPPADRRQQETDAKFDRAMQRALQREGQI